MTFAKIRWNLPAAACLAICLVSKAALAGPDDVPPDETHRLQPLWRFAVGYASDPLSGLPSTGLGTSLLLGLRYADFVVGAEGAYLFGTRIVDIPSRVTGSDISEGHLRSYRGNLIGQYELRWDRFRLAPTLGVGVDGTTLTTEDGVLSASTQLVLLQGVGLAYVPSSH